VRSARPALCCSASGRSARTAHTIQHPCKTLESLPAPMPAARYDSFMQQLCQLLLLGFADTPHHPHLTIVHSESFVSDYHQCIIMSRNGSCWKCKIVIFKFSQLAICMPFVHRYRCIQLSHAFAKWRCHVEAAICNGLSQVQSQSAPCTAASSTFKCV